jgi:hypothetical protein
MSMFYVATIALIVSAIPLVALCVGDPKRRRSIRRKDSGMALGRRRMLAAAACLPGVFCVVFGGAAAFLMWLGGCALLGWALAASLGARRDRDVLPRRYLQRLLRSIGRPHVEKDA